MVTGQANWQVYRGWPFDEAEARRRQEETARALGVGVEQDIDLGKGVKMRLVLIPAGEFLMGSPPTASPEELARKWGGDVEWFRPEFPQHRVTIPKPFWLGKFPVTQEQWEAAMGYNPSRSAGSPRNPVGQVVWQRCQNLVRKLAATLGKAFRLPSEAEWEYACRAGALTEFCFGDDAAKLEAYAWFGEATGSIHPVGERRPNAWGLHDIHGNVWEWCEDAWHPDYQGAPDDGSAWLAGGDQSFRVVRGGSWNTDPRYCRAARRRRSNPASEWSDVGVRVVLRDF